jgi:hypothetical protein
MRSYFPNNNSTNHLVRSGHFCISVRNGRSHPILPTKSTLNLVLYGHLFLLLVTSDRGLPRQAEAPVPSFLMEASHNAPWKLVDESQPLDLEAR